MNEPVRRSAEQKTLQQLQREAAAAAGSDLWACPRCGCRDWRVVNSHEYGGPRRRQRECRNCGYDLPTLEVPIPDGHTIKVVGKDEAPE